VLGQFSQLGAGQQGGEELGAQSGDHCKGPVRARSDHLRELRPRGRRGLGQQLLELVDDQDHPASPGSGNGEQQLVDDVVQSTGGDTPPDLVQTHPGWLS
jgi:hypothetical protein